MATDTKFEELKHTDIKWLEVRRKRICDLVNGIFNEVFDGRVLDVAMGKWSLVKAHFPELFVVGVDRQNPMSSPDEFHTANLKKGLPFKDSEFSLVFAGEILEHLGEEGAKLLLEDSFRVLQKGGYLILTTPNGYRNKFKQFLNSPEIEAHEEEFSFSWVKSHMIETGFKIITTNGIQPIFIPWRLTTRFASLKFPSLLSSQLVFLAKKN